MNQPSPPERSDPSTSSTILSSQSAIPPSVPGFELLKSLGKGAMGEVYHARDTATGAEVALKLVAPHLLDRPDLRQRFAREAKLLIQLRHPNIAGAVSHSLDGAQPHIAMEFVKGPTLASLLRVVGAFHEMDVLRIGRQISLALGYAWDEVGLVHRDIKPANLLVIPESNGEGETVKIIDFGLARTQESVDLGMTLPGMVMGTPNYMSPEQIRGDERIGPQADMYALGCTLFHLLTGSLPFEATSPAEMLSRHLQDRVPDPGSRVASLASPTRHLVMTLMAKSADKRYRSHQDVVAACDAGLRTLELRDTKTIRLLRRPMVLSRPRAIAPPDAGGAASVVDPFSFETARVRRSNQRDDARGSEYEPTSGSAEVVGSPAQAEPNQPPTTARRGKATEALVKATTESIQRKKGTAQIRRGGTSVHRRVRDLGTSGPTVVAPPQAAPPSEPLEPVHHDERHWVPWVMVGLTVLLLAGVVVHALTT
jgi:serine/threonine protein kinase